MSVRLRVCCKLEQGRANMAEDYIHLQLPRALALFPPPNRPSLAPTNA